MRKWLLIIVHALLWSVFSIFVWLSKEDHLQAKFLLFLLFIFLAVRVAKYFYEQNIYAIYVSALNIVVYFSGKYLFVIFYQWWYA